MPPVIHITYATPSFSQAAHLLRRSARRFGIAETRCYTPEHPALREAWQNQPEIMGSRRGAGYWLWKAYIIEDALRSAQDGTAVLYTDAALTFIADPKVMIELAEEHPTCLFSLKKAQLSSKWTKRDCFIEMDADTPEFWNLPILMGGVQLYRAGPEAREFAGALKAAMGSVARLTDAPNIHGMPNLPGFIDHRHDQSVLTILAKQRGAAIFPDPSQFGPWDTDTPEAPFRQLVHCHRRKNRNLFSWMRGRLNGQYTGGRGFI